jgi:hypothetical protein
MAAHAQVNVPTSGAMLTIQGTVANPDVTPVNIIIYDSQIHSGQLGPAALPGTCTSSDSVVTTDAYVLQGGSATGCNPGDAFEVTDDNGLAVVGGVVMHQSVGTKDITKSAGQLAGSVALPGTGFHIETHYCMNGIEATCGAKGVVTVATLVGNQFCNTSQTICASPNTGFLSVTNNTGYPFTGMITLQGNSAIAGGNCANSVVEGGPGVASDSASYTAAVPLANNASVALALGTQRFPDPAGLSDSSDCGGFNFDQLGPLADAGGGQLIATFQANNDDFIVQCLTCAAGDIATWRPVPVPQSLFQIGAGSTVGAGQTCVTFADFSSPNAAQPFGVCPLFETHCNNCSDPESFFWNGTYDYIIDANTIPNPIGGVHFLGDPGANCKASLPYFADIGLSYTGAQPGVDPIPPQHSGSGGGLNCFVATYVQGAPAIPVGVTEYAFSPLEPPVAPDLPGQPMVINLVEHNRKVPLNFDLNNGVGGPPVTDAVLCTVTPTSVNGVLSCNGLGGDWVFLGMTDPFACPGNGAASVNAATLTDDTSVSTQNFINHGDGTYTAIMKVPSSAIGQCFNVNMATSFGQVQHPAATFQVK